jgi:hypothetical protein
VKRIIKGRKCVFVKLNPLA